MTCRHRIEAKAHLRIVTVGGRAWVFELDASALPLDWREEPRAHRDWIIAERCEQARSAARLAAAMQVGYSSQDWIVATDGRCVFLDLNPSGQWLFLPDPAANEVTVAIAEWLEGVS